MYGIESNVEEVMRKATSAIQASLGIGATRSPMVERAMRRGIQEHFNKLSNGGGSDSTALGAGVDARTRIRWRPSRHKYTVLEHRAGGVDPNMLLISTGAMRDAFTSGAIVEGEGFGHGWGSAMRLRGGTPDAVAKAMKNRGGYARGDFPRIGKRNVLILFPDRQFVYWDEAMRDAAVRAALEAAEAEWRR